MNQAGVEWSGEKWNGEDGEEWRKKPVQKIVALSLQSICQLISSGQDTSSFLFPNLFFPVCFVLFNSVPFLLFVHVPGRRSAPGSTTLGGVFQSKRCTTAKILNAIFLLLPTSVSTGCTTSLCQENSLHLRILSVGTWRFHDTLSMQSKQQLRSKHFQIIFWVRIQKNNWINDVLKLFCFSFSFSFSFTPIQDHSGSIEWFR